MWLEAGDGSGVHWGQSGADKARAWTLGGLETSSGGVAVLGAEPRDCFALPAPPYCTLQWTVSTPTPKEDIVLKENVPTKCVRPDVKLGLVLAQEVVTLMPTDGPGNGCRR